MRSAGFGNVTIRDADFPFFNLYRLAVVARGNALVKDAAGQDGQGLPLAARATIRMFSLLFKLNVSQVDPGWQLVALAS